MNNDEIYLKIIELRKQGKSFVEIAQEVDKSIHFVSVIWSQYQSDKCCFKKDFYKE